MQYERTVIKARWDKESKGFIAEKPQPPAGEGWRMVNFQPVVSPEPFTTFFLAIWEKETD